jgi:hypothetical protein
VHRCGSGPARLPYLERLSRLQRPNIADMRLRVLVKYVAKRPALIALLVLAACSSPQRDGSGTSSPAPSAGWLFKEGTARCVEAVAEKTLARRSWAFDGTIERVIVPSDPEDQAPTEVVFTVHRWFKGGSGAKATVKTYSRPDAVGSDGGPDPSIGARILASGVDVYLWSCGFSMPYSDENAQMFTRVFGNG